MNPYARALAWMGLVALGLAVQAGESTRYQLIEGSTFVRDCPICAGPTILWNLTGTFVLEATNQNPLVTTYAVRDVAFSAGFNPKYEITGGGQLRIGGEVALRQEMELNVLINGEPVTLTNEDVSVSRPWPMLAIELRDANPTATRDFFLTLAAAPLREIWFSTAHGFTPADFDRPRGSPGDLLSSAGRVVRSNQQLIQSYNFAAPIPGGNDAFEVGPGGEVLFSLNETAFSQELGAIQHGDLLSERGERKFLNQQLVEEFGLAFDALDLGLDALVAQDDGEVLFSLTTDIESPNAGQLHRGDLLSNRGVVARRFNELLSRFHPPQKTQDYGLDAVYMWPSGEIWFSTEDGFQDEQLGPIQHGDLISDQGYIVIRNLDLLGPFQPIEDLADFGLDGLFIVTDVTPKAPPPRLELPILREDGVTLRWQGPGRVFQLFKAETVVGPWVEASPIIPGSEFEDLTPPVQPLVVYRLRQW